jgi:hypothetical protein
LIHREEDEVSQCGILTHLLSSPVHEGISQQQNIGLLSMLNLIRLVIEANRICRDQKEHARDLGSFVGKWRIAEAWLVTHTVYDLVPKAGLNQQ